MLGSFQFDRFHNKTYEEILYGLELPVEIS
jgi:hypothetical protein